MKLSCLIIDDEPVARKGLAGDLASLGFVTVEGMAADIQTARNLLVTQPVDLLFLDIEMPGGNGLDFLNSLPVKPLVILVTAYPQYALKGYEHGVVDYLLKPVALHRLRSACEKAVEWHALRTPAEQHVFLKCNGAQERIAVADILYIEAANNYIRVHTRDKKLLIYLSLKGIEEQLPKADFIQVHKSFIIARRHIRRIDAAAIVIGETLIPLSRRYKSRVLTQLQLTNNFPPDR